MRIGFVLSKFPYVRRCETKRLWVLRSHDRLMVPESVYRPSSRLLKLLLCCSPRSMSLIPGRTKSRKALHKRDNMYCITIIPRKDSSRLSIFSVTADTTASGCSANGQLPLLTAEKPTKTRKSLTASSTVAGPLALSRSVAFPFDTVPFFPPLRFGGPILAAERYDSMRYEKR